MKKLARSILLIGVFCGAGSPSPVMPVATPVSLVRILAAPERYQRLRVAVRGYYHYEFEGSALYISREDARYRIDENSIWISPPVSNAHTNGIQRASDAYVLIEGTLSYESGGTGHKRGWIAEIKDVTLLVKLPEHELPGDRSPGGRK